ncbi:hypothetical protein [Actinobacillus vicugnae]|uniref:hypothetical protein n=1 Tax=Actinobacillus vicugnae TaxID=2573093 RepID=UPI001241AE0D|nr:hypothetical protein [Actinobacillus vicugnae]
MKSIYWKLIILFFIAFVNSYIFLGGFAKNSSTIQKETRRIYRILTTEIINMNGEYKQFGGQIIRTFTLEVNWNIPESHNQSRVFNKIESLGFNLKNVEKNNFYLFCKGKSGFLVATSPIFQIEYENDMFDCANLLDRTDY